MADLYFYRSLSVLVWPAWGGHWAAVSGVAGSSRLQPLPPGLYNTTSADANSQATRLTLAWHFKTRREKDFLYLFSQRFLLREAHRVGGLEYILMEMFRERKAVSG